MNINDKPILALETSGKLCSAAIYFSEDSIFEFNSILKHSQSEKIFETVDHLLNTSGITIRDLGCIAVSSGPGSFTGLRIGLSTAKGIAFGASLPICPVPTFEALALQIMHYLNDEDTFVIAKSANIEELYYAKFFIKGNNYIFADKLELIKKTELKEKVHGELLYGDSGLSANNISVPTAVYIARWCKRYGAEYLTADYDFMEPNYLKNFVVKERKK